MSFLAKAKRAARKVTGRPGPRLLTVQKAWYLTPNMIRVIFAGPELDGFPAGHDGGNCKLMLPEPGESKAAFSDRLQNGPAPTRRTFTVRHFDAEAQTLAIDFVAHGDDGPATRWAMQAQPGSFLGFAGPSGPKVARFDAHWYLVAADPSAIPVAAATLEAMPKEAKGIVIFEITSEADRQDIDIPEGMEVHCLIHPDPHTDSKAQEHLIRSIDWPDGRAQTCIAGESGVIRSLRAYVAHERHVPREDTYISGYWKIGMQEDAHQQAKRAGEVG